MYLASTFATAQAVGNGSIFRIPEDFSTPYRIYPPTAVATIQRYVSAGRYLQRLYLVGGHTSNLLIDEQLRCLRQGISAPDAPPSVSVGAGSTVQIGYTRFYDELTTERSPLSPGFSFTGDLNRVWTVIPTIVPNEEIIIEGLASIAAGAVTSPGGKTNFDQLRPGDRIARAADTTRWATIRSITSATAMTIDDTTMSATTETLVCKPFSRVSHVELWLSVTGALPRFVMRVRIGTTTASESTATLALGEAEVSSFTKFPWARYNLVYADRQVTAGFEKEPDTVRLSAIGFPERYEGLAFKTKYGEPIVGLFRYRDYVIVLCPDSSYVLQGYTEDDMTMTVLEPNLGGLGHHTNRLVNGYAVIPGRRGVFLFNGGWHQAVQDRRSEWTAAYDLQRLAYENGLAAVNANWETYEFIPHYVDYTVVGPSESKFTSSKFIWLADYSPVGSMAGGSITPPNWADDTFQGPLAQWTYAAYLVRGGTNIGKMYRADAGGRIYEENQFTAHYENSIITPAHQFFGDAGGKRDEGKRLIRIWSYVVSEDSAWKVRVWPGDEYAYPPSVLEGSPFGGQNNVAAPGYEDSVAASRDQSFGYTYLGSPSTVRRQPRSVHIHQLGAASSPSANQGRRNVGRGFSFEYIFTTPLQVEFLGLGGEWGVGMSSRPMNMVALTG